MYYTTFMSPYGSGYLSLLVMLIGAIVIVYARHDLLLESVGSGLLLTAFAFIYYQILLIFFPQLFINQWFIHNLSGLLPLGIPLEEYLWHFAWGALIGPAYEYLKGVRLKHP